MLYVSTRGKTDLFSAAHAITRGLAADGGLFVPQNIPAMRMVDIKAMERKPYTERAVDVLLQYLTDFSEDELRECVNAAYAPEKFGDNPVPLVQVNDNTVCWSCGMARLLLLRYGTAAFAASFDTFDAKDR